MGLYGAEPGLQAARDVLLVMDQRGQIRMVSLLLGSVSDTLLRSSRTPVTVVS